MDINLKNNAQKPGQVLTGFLKSIFADTDSFRLNRAAQPETDQQFKRL